MFLDVSYCTIHTYATSYIYIWVPIDLDKDIQKGPLTTSGDMPGFVEVLTVCLLLPRKFALP